VFPALTCIFADQARTPPPSQRSGHTETKTTARRITT